MTGPSYPEIVDVSRPRPVRISAFAGAAMTAVLSVLTATEVVSPVVAGSLLGLVTLVSIGGWLFVEQKVTPLSSPATTLGDGTLARLKPAPAAGPLSGDLPEDTGGLGGA